MSFRGKGVVQIWLKRHNQHVLLTPQDVNEWYFEMGMYTLSGWREGTADLEILEADKL